MRNWLLGIGSTFLTVSITAIGTDFGKETYAFVKDLVVGKSYHSLAVFPFKNERSDSDVEYLSEGLTDGVIGRLSRLSKIRVTPKTRVLRYRGGRSRRQHGGERARSNCASPRAS